MKAKWFLALLWTVRVFIPNQKEMVFETVEKVNFYVASTMIELHLKDGRTFYVPAQWTVLEKSSEFPSAK